MTPISCFGWKQAGAAGAAATGLGLFAGHRLGLLSDAKAFFFGAAPAQTMVPAAQFFKLSARDLEGHEFPFSDLKGKVALITNVSSR